MRNRWIWRAGGLVAAVAALCLLTTRNPQTILGVEVVTQEVAARYLDYEYQNMAPVLRYDDERACVDVVTSTIYISQDIQEGMSPYEMKGLLELDAAGEKLYFVWDDAFDDFSSAVAEGNVFTLLITDGSSSYMKYNVIFTTLPVIMMMADGFEEENVQGMVYLWDPYDEETGGSRAVSMRGAWHVRGASSQAYAKKSYKLSLREENGENKNADFLGLGADDDWILNPMNMDDTRMKDKLAMEIWNSIADTGGWNYPASKGEYVEFILNGEYRGLYLLQRRIDRKYLNLHDEILFKGKNTWIADTVMDAYEIIYSPMNLASTYEAMTWIWGNAENIDLDNFVDISILLQYGTMADNAGYKNMYYLLCPEEDGYRVAMIPWDMDLSFGITWSDGFVYDYDTGMDSAILRRDYDNVLALHPDLNRRIAERWFQLRQGVLSRESILSIFCESKSKISDSGAYERDISLWGELYDGHDTHEALEQWLCERLQWCDEYYSE